MSDYKEIETQVELTSEQQLVDALGMIFDHPPVVERNVIGRNRWSHERRLAVCIRQKDLPDYLQGYGDVGFELKNGKYVPIGISDQDSHYVDSIKGLEEGTFTTMMNGFFGEVENTYALLTEAQNLQARLPSVTIGSRVMRPQDAEDPNAMAIECEVDADIFARMGIQLPV